MVCVVYVVNLYLAQQTLQAGARTTGGIFSILRVSARVTVMSL